MSYQDALIVDGEFVNQSGAGVLNRTAFEATPNFSLANSPVYFAGLRNPGMFTTDASILKRFYLGEKSRYIRSTPRSPEYSQSREFRQHHQRSGLADLWRHQWQDGQRVMQIGFRFFF